MKEFRPIVLIPILSLVIALPTTSFASSIEELIEYLSQGRRVLWDSGIYYTGQLPDGPLSEQEKTLYLEQLEVYLETTKLASLEQSRVKDLMYALGNLIREEKSSKIVLRAIWCAIQVKWQTSLDLKYFAGIREVERLLSSIENRISGLPCALKSSPPLQSAAESYLKVWESFNASSSQSPDNGKRTDIVCPAHLLSRGIHN